MYPPFLLKTGYHSYEKTMPIYENIESSVPTAWQSRSHCLARPFTLLVTAAHIACYGQPLRLFVYTPAIPTFHGHPSHLSSQAKGDGGARYMGRYSVLYFKTILGDTPLSIQVNWAKIIK